MEISHVAGYDEVVVIVGSTGGFEEAAFFDENWLKVLAAELLVGGRDVNKLADEVEEGFEEGGGFWWGLDRGDIWVVY